MIAPKQPTPDERRSRMKLVAFLDLARQPQRTLLRLPGGELLLPTLGQDGSFLEAYDPDLAAIWSVRLNEHPYGGPACPGRNTLGA
jgi:hypothetical protein